MRSNPDLHDAVAKARTASLLYQARPTVQHFLSFGRDLFLLKERVGHGNFQKCLNLLEVSLPKAAKCMNVFSWFQGQRAEDIAERIGVPSKLVELVGALDDAEMHALLRLDPVRGLALAEIESLSCRDLRSRLHGKSQRQSPKADKPAGFSPDEMSLISAYRRCDHHDRTRVIGIVNLLADLNGQVNN